jgi:transposase
LNSKLPDAQCSSVPNDKIGWAALVEQLRDYSIAAIGIEASGGYERGVIRSLHAAGMPVRQVNPFKLRQFARASGVLAKNDPLDARMIASFVAIMPTRPAQPHVQGAGRLARCSPFATSSAPRRSLGKSKSHQWTASSWHGALAEHGRTSARRPSDSADRLGLFGSIQVG